MRLPSDCRAICCSDLIGSCSRVRWMKASVPWSVCPSAQGKRSRYMLAVCECERRQSAPQPAAAPAAEAVAGAMEGAGRRRARPRLRGAVRQRAGRRRVELRRADHARLPDRPIQARHGAIARSHRGARRGERRSGADRSRMPRGGVGDATGTVPEAVPGAPTPCQGRKRPPVPATANDRGGARYGGRPTRQQPVSPGRGSLRRRSTPALVEQPDDRLASPGRDHGQARSRLHPSSVILRRREGLGPERLSHPVGGQPRIRSVASSAEERPIWKKDVRWTRC